MRVETISIVCPNCGYPTRNEIAVHAGVQTYTHQRIGQVNCRLIVAPDPAGTDHLVQVVPDHVEMCDFLEAVLSADPDLLNRHVRLLHAGLAIALDALTSPAEPVLAIA